MTQVGEESGFRLTAGFAANVVENRIPQIGNSISGGCGSSNLRRCVRLSLASSCRALLIQTVETGSPDVIANEIVFVRDYNRRTSRDLAQKFLVVIREALRGIEYDKNEIGIDQRFHGFPDADALSLIEGAANAGGVDEFDRNAADGDRFADKITSSAGGRGHNGTLVLYQAVKQTRFAHVGPAHDGQRQAFMNDLSISERGGQFFKRSLDCGDALQNLVSRKNRDIVFGKVDS